jgi:eukaryotic-like serine/threonine-protein kinase
MATTPPAPAEDAESAPPERGEHLAAPPPLEGLTQPDATLPAFGSVPAEGVLDVLTLTPGMRVGSHYTVHSVLGAGGMGIVVQARDELLMRDVALKFVSPTLLGHGDARRRFLEEARVMARVRSPNVVEVYAFGEHEGRPYFVMEYVNGITADTWFRERMMQGGPPPIDEALGILEQCCRGVSAIHGAGALHGDLKPSNVLLGAGFRVALADFGLSSMRDHEGADEVAGTPQYMAPEAFATGGDRALAARRDVYALGVIAYQFFTGRVPFRVERHAATRTLFRLGDLTPPSALRSELPSAFDAPILRALASDPAERTDSAEAMRRELLHARRAVSERKFAARVLVVDDDPDFLALVDRTLRATFPGIVVVSVSDGASALEELGRHHADLCLLDLRLPDMNGLEVTLAIRAQPEHQRMPILVITAHGGGPDWQVLSSVGASAFMVKPVDPASLAALVGRSLEQRRPSRPS